MRCMKVVKYLTYLMWYLSKIARLRMLMEVSYETKRKLVNI